MKYIKSPLAFAAIALLLAGCNGSTSKEQQAATRSKSDLELYNESVSAYRAAAPKGELETTEQYLARKQQAAAAVQGKQYKLRIPVSFGKCAKQEKEAPLGTDTYVGLLYDADHQSLQVCPLELMKALPGDRKESTAMVRTSTTTSRDSYKGHNLFGVEREIEVKTIESTAFFFRWEGSSHVYNSAAYLTYPLESAKSLHDTGAFLVYDIRVGSGDTGPIQIEKEKTPTLLDPVEITERIRGYPVELTGIALEDKAGMVIARFTMQSETWLLAHVEAPDAKVQPAQNKTSTRYGDFVVNDFGAYWKGKLFSKRTGDSMIIKSLQKFGEQDVALAFLGSGGSGGYGDFALIVFTPDSKAKLLESDVGEMNITPVVKRNDPKNKRLEIDLGYRQKQRITAVYDGGKITVAKEDAEPIALPDDACKVLYATYQHCAEPPGDMSCSNRPETLSNAENDGLYEAYHYPGNEDHHLQAYCDKVCKTKQVPPYPAFQKIACNPQLENAGVKRLLEDEISQ